jgi:tRNA threonylcarbamoyladenosine biosynthesis protein TsaE
MAGKDSKGMEFRSFEKEDLAGIAKKLLDLAGERRVFFFYGEVGAGKTTLIQELCRQLGVAQQVQSPTFSLVNVYERQDTGEEINHLDLYRLKSAQEALDIDIEGYLYSGNFCFVEWPELIERWAPEDTIRIKLSIADETSRNILFL